MERRVESVEGEIRSTEEAGTPPLAQWGSGSSPTHGLRGCMAYSVAWPTVLHAAQGAQGSLEILLRKYNHKCLGTTCIFQQVEEAFLPDQATMPTTLPCKHFEHCPSMPEGHASVLLKQNGTFCLILLHS